ncbi:helix-turn-helix transcriptional regulator [Serratia aquatilis]|uniref:Helix-turn-helix transcriptional regulator n=1 Tax=Serratia aquatilis TaxID=1737515 RepID=A0ABV6EK23_9GAMM
MNRKIGKGTFIFYEPHPWVRKGLQALIDPVHTCSNSFERLKEIEMALNDNGKQTVIMELYNHSENLYDVIQFVLTVRIFWADAAIVIFTDVTNPSILAILAAHPHLSLISKRDKLDCLLNAIEAANLKLIYRSPEIERIQGQLIQPLSQSEWRILAFMTGGANSQRIANATQRSYKTVSTHKLNVMRKLKLNQADFMRLVLVFRTRYFFDYIESV